MRENSTVLVTGATGFIASHCVLQLLEAGYHVRGSVRSSDAGAELRTALEKHTQALDRLTFVFTDLTQEDGWEEAMAGCEYVLHVASPAPAALPKHEDDLIIPAVEGTLRVLRAAAKQGVKRVVLTSSVAAVNYGHEKAGRKLDENDWSVLDDKIQPYPKSKTLAERAAWEFVEQQTGENRLELAVINPVYVYGPLILGRKHASIALIYRLMTRAIPGCLDLNFSVVDVRDVAKAHVAAMGLPEAAGKRFILYSETVSMQEVARILDRHYRTRGYKIPTMKFPNFVVHILARFDPAIRLVKRSVGRRVEYSNARLKQVLGIEPLGAEAAVVAMAESLIVLGMV